MIININIIHVYYGERGESRRVPFHIDIPIDIVNLSLGRGMLNYILSIPLDTLERQK